MEKGRIKQYFYSKFHGAKYYTNIFGVIKTSSQAWLSPFSLYYTTFILAYLKLFRLVFERP